MNKVKLLGLIQMGKLQNIKLKRENTGIKK